MATGVSNSSAPAASPTPSGPVPGSGLRSLLKSDHEVIDNLAVPTDAAAESATGSWGARLVELVAFPSLRARSMNWSEGVRAATNRSKHCPETETKRVYWAADFAKAWLELMLQEFFIHSRGQIPAHEWNCVKLASDGLQHFVFEGR